MGQCVVCGEVWGGMSKAHCSNCHRLFKSVSAFDAHRRNLKCVDPEESGMTMKDGVWAKWLTEDEKAALYGSKHGARRS